MGTSNTAGKSTSLTVHDSWISLTKSWADELQILGHMQISWLGACHFVVSQVLFELGANG